MAELMEQQKEKNITSTKQIPYKSRYNGRAKKRQWEYDNRKIAEAKRAAVADIIVERIKKKKCALLLGYSGADYYGMQRNPGMKTIEEDLFVAMLKNKWIMEDAFAQPQLVQFQRAARTDKGVSAARQCCSIKLRREYIDPSAKRYIMSFICGEPFVNPSTNVEFATISIKGQSFMLHQIRKMIGLSLAVLRGHTSTETITRSFTDVRLDIPMAPGLGLVLDTVHYDKYNRRYGDDGMHEPLNWEKEESEIQDFLNKHIYSTIFETEFKEKSMLTWLETLSLHSYDVRSDDKEQQQQQLTEKSDSKELEEDDE